MSCRPLLAALALAGFLAAWAGGEVPVIAAAHATTVAEMSVEQMVDASNLVVRGTVESTGPFLDAQGRIWTATTVVVSESYKGKATAGERLVVKNLGGTLGGAVGMVEFAPRYSVEEEVVLFLHRRGDGDYQTVGLGLGKYTVRINPADGSEMVVRYSVPLDRPYDARFIPHPPVGERVSVESFRSQVEVRAASGWDGKAIPGISNEELRNISPVLTAGGVK